MKNFFIASQIEENGKWYAHIIKVSENDNLLSRLEIKNIKMANICKTKKRAEECVMAWTEGYKRDGKYMFDKPF